MPETPDFELLRGMWAACADDLRRWARAFNDTTALTVDSGTCDALEQLARTLEAKAAKDK